MPESKLRTLILSIFAIYGVFILSIMMVRGSAGLTHYNSIRPYFAPNYLWLFIMWGAFNIFLVISLYKEWANTDVYYKKLLAYVYAHELFFSAVWVLIFFGLDNQTLAFAGALLILSSLSLIGKVNKEIKRKSNYILIPYLLWVFYISSINYVIVALGLGRT